MKQVVLKYGAIAGVILAVMVFTMGAIVGDSTDFEKGESLGYIFMISAFSTIFFGIRAMRDNVLGGAITFNTAFRTGLLITIVGSACYVVAWMIFFNYIDNTFVERYTEYYVSKVQQSGKNAADIEQEISSFKTSMENYNNPFVMMLYTFLEIFPMGLLITILCSFLMKKKAQA